MCFTKVLRTCLSISTSFFYFYDPSLNCVHEVVIQNPLGYSIGKLIPVAFRADCYLERCLLMRFDTFCKEARFVVADFNKLTSYLAASKNYREFDQKASYLSMQMFKCFLELSYRFLVDVSSIDCLWPSDFSELKKMIDSLLKSLSHVDGPFFATSLRHNILFHDKYNSLREKLRNSFQLYFFDMCLQVHGALVSPMSNQFAGAFQIIADCGSEIITEKTRSVANKIEVFARKISSSVPCCMPTASANIESLAL